MPTYKVRDSATGKTVTLSGDSPPSDQELNDIFNNLPTTPVQPEQIAPSKTVQTISTMARPALEVGGALVGGFAGGAMAAPTGLGAGPAAVIGGGLGYAGGKSAADLLDRALGVKPPIASVKEGLAEAGQSLKEGAISEGLTFGMGKFARPAKSIGKRLMSTTLGPSVKDIESRAARSLEMKGAKPLVALAEEFPEGVQQLANNLKKSSDAALESLSPSKYIMGGASPKTQLIHAIELEKKSIGRSISDSDMLAKKTLDRYSARLKKLGNTVSERELGDIVRKMDDDIDWLSTEKMPLNNALQGIRVRIDTILKAGNKDYAQKMIPVDEEVRLLKKAQRLFGVKKESGKGFLPTDRTATALKSAEKETRLESQDVLGKLKGVTGRDYLREVENAGLAERFAGGKTQGSRRVNIGAAVGGAVGGLTGGWAGAGMGSATGAMTGAYLDTEGGKIAAAIIDRLAKSGLPVSPEVVRRAVAASLAPLSRQAPAVASAAALALERKRKEKK